MKRIHLIPTTFQNRLIIGLVILLVLVVSVATVSLLSIQSMNDTIDEIVQVSSTEIGRTTQLRMLLFQVSNSVHDYIILGGMGRRETFTQLSLQIEEIFDEILTTSTSDEEEDAIIQARQSWKQIHKIAETILETPDPQRTQIPVQQKVNLDVFMGMLFNTTGQLTESIVQKAYVQQLKAKNVAERALFFIYLILGLGTIIAVTIVFFLIRSVLVPVRLLKQGADKFGKGDLSHRVPVVSTDELGELARAFNTMAKTLEKDQEELEQLAINDGLTGLYNHREFQRRLQVEIERARRYKHHLSLLMLDIDHFKRFNDTYGHQAGDYILRSLSLQMREGVRAVDWVARYGGEEFVITLPEMTVTKALIVAERLRKNIEARVVTVKEDQKVNITVSIGVATFPEDADSKDKLIAAADRALYAAKAAGRNKVLRAV